MRHSLFLFAITLAALCLGQTYPLEIHAAIDGEPGYCDSLLALVGASPGAGIHDIPAGDSVTISIDTTLVEVAIGTRDSCYGWTSIASTPDSTHGGGLSLSFAMTGNATVIWNFKRQFTFEVTCSYDYDSPEPDYGIHWFDNGDSITASIDMMVGDTVCLGYIGTGSVDTGPSNSWTGILDEPSTLYWYINIAEPPCSLIVISEHGECSPYIGVTYFPVCCYITAYVSAVDSSDSALGIIYTCIGWRGEGCVPATGPTPYVPPYNFCEITCTDYGILEWLWDTLYTGIPENPSAKPAAFVISAYPNPFNSSVTIALDGVGDGSPVPLSVEIYDVAGRMVAVAEPVEVPVGEGLKPSRSSITQKTGGSKTAPLRNGEFIWRPDESLGSGVFLIRATVGGETSSNKIIYLK